MISDKTLTAIGLALLAALGAHSAGKAWWVDQPFLADAFDVGLVAFVIIRCLLALFDRSPA